MNIVSFKLGKEGFYCVKIVVILLLIKYKCCTETSDETTLNC